VVPLSDIFAQYGHPDPAIVSVLNKNGVDLSYVGHGEITKALIEIDPNWTWQPVLGADGMPAIRTQKGQIPRRDKEPILVDMVTMWGTMTLNGVTRWAVGSVEAHKPDLDKELVSDFIRNAAMRFGVALGLWIKDTANAQPVNKVQRMTQTTTPGSEVVTEKPANAPSDKQLWLVKKLHKDAGKLPPHNLGSMDKFEVSRLIESLKSGDEVPPPSDTDFPEEPF
jgi:hypothetical protein